MYLRDFCRISVMVFSVAVFGLSMGAAGADETIKPKIAAASLSAVKAVGPQISIWLKLGKNTTSFCGACSNSDHDACGGQSNGWSCCSSGCSDSKMQCWNVTSCDKIAALGNGSPPNAQNGSDRELRREPVTVAQSDQCTNWYNNIQSEQSSYNYQCSGELSQSQYDYCANWQSQINSEVSSYNSQCG